MSDVNANNTIIPQPAPSSLSGNTAAYEDNQMGAITGGNKRKNRKTKKVKNTRKTNSKKARKTAKCWWKFF